VSMLVHNASNFLRCIEIIDYLPKFVYPYIVECKFHMTNADGIREIARKGGACV
jgi:hypothetical protein